MDNFDCAFDLSFLDDPTTPLNDGPGAGAGEVALAYYGMVRELSITAPV
jgi:hypothetical protein